MQEISKDFSFCYGHRVYTQELNPEFSIDSSCKCRHLHGHEALVTVFLTSSELDKAGMVTDFKHLGWLKNWLDDNIDHKFIISRYDPVAPTLIPDWVYNYYKDVRVDTRLAGWTIDIKKYLQENPDSLDSTQVEYLGSFFIVDFVPTSEHLSKWLYGLVQHKMQKLNVKVSKIDWWETPKSRATYVPD